MNWLTLASIVLPCLSAVSANATYANAASAAEINSKSYYYDQLFEDGRLDVTIALGFEQRKSTIENIVGRSIGDILVSPLRDTPNTLRDVANIENEILGCMSCGFTLASSGKGFRIFTGTFPYAGKTIRAQLKFFFSEPGVTIAGIRGEFIKALGNDDVIMYLGHSRHGEGFPDFAAPIADTGKIFSNDPVQGWTGFEKGYFSRKKYQILVLNACQTARYFKEALRTHVWEKDPAKLALILSSDDTWFEDYPSTTAALLMSLVAQRSSAELLASLDDASDFYRSQHLLEEKQKPLFVGDGFFDTTYERKKTPKRRMPNEPMRDFPF